MTVHVAVAAASLALVASAASTSDAAAPAIHASAAGDCAGVVVIVEYAELGGADRVACAKAGGSAAEMFDEVGVVLEYQPGMQDFVCTVDGLPADRDCTGSNAYWSLWWSDGTTEWVYATLGVTSLEVDEGYVAFAWHQGAGEAEPPSLDVGDRPTASASTTEERHVEPSDEDDPGGGRATLLGLGGAVLVVGAAALVSLLRRRRS